MNNAAWRAYRPLLCTLAGTVIALPTAAKADGTAEFVAYYQEAYSHGRDLVPGPQSPLDTSSIATRLDLQSVSPQGVLTGNAFLAADGTITRLAGIEGCISTAPIDFAGVRAACAMVSLAGMTATIDKAKASAGNAFPCHALGQNAGRPTVRFAECFYMEDGVVNSLSEVLVSKGLAFAARSGSGQPVFPEYARAEEAARRGKAGIWSSDWFVHPYGERFRAGPSTH